MNFLKFSNRVHQRFYFSQDILKSIPRIRKSHVCRLDAYRRVLFNIFFFSLKSRSAVYAASEQF